MPDYSSLPSVTALASIPELAGCTEKLRNRIAKLAIDAARLELDGNRPFDITSLALNEASKAFHLPLNKVINMSGVILHTGLGRAPGLVTETFHYMNLEIDLETGKRGDRQDHVRSLLCQLTGAEDAFVVNNGAAAVLLVLSACCSRKEVLLSRGQSVEIGGSFRMPDVIKTSGCKLVDVGTTNKTRAQDYADAITAKTAAILQCHPSNFEVKGFTSTPTTKELAEAAHQHGVLFINDQGNGALIDFREYGIHGIETLPQSVAAGADISIGSGDKLLGGPQCGIVLGRKELIAKMAKHPLARALRIDKNSLLILQKTLRKYVHGWEASIPLFKLLGYPPEMIKSWCEGIAPDGAKIIETITEIGSGAAPGQGVQSYAVALNSNSPDKLLAELRKKRIIGRISKGQVLLDPRTNAEYLNIFRDGKWDFNFAVAINLKDSLTECWEKWK